MSNYREMWESIYGSPKPREKKTMPNEANRRNLKAQMDCLSDAHAEITKRAALINSRLLDADTRNNVKPGNGAISLKFAGRQFDTLLADLEQQERRVARVRAELEQIKQNLRVI